MGGSVPVVRWAHSSCGIPFSGSWPRAISVGTTQISTACVAARLPLRLLRLVSGRIVSEAYLDVCRAIKRALDPNHILDPGKIFDV